MSAAQARAVSFHTKARIRAWLEMALVELLKSVVGGFFRDGHVVDVAFAQPR